MKTGAFPSACLAALVTCLGFAAHAQSGAGNFTLKGKTVGVYIGATPGGGYDLYGRLLARFIGRHLPGSPSVVARNMPNGSGREVMNYIYNIAPKDGSALGITLHDVPFAPLLGGTATKIDASRVTWVGSMNSDVNVCLSWHTSGFRTLDDLRKRTMLVGSNGPSSAHSILPKLLDHVAGTKLHVVEGYAGGSEVDLAMERGEVDGTCGVTWDELKSKDKAWMDKKEVTALVQFALSPAPDLPDTPFIMNLAKSTADKQLATLILGSNKMGRPIFAPPGLAPEVVAGLRTAFDETMKDPQLLAAAAKERIQIIPMKGGDVAALVHELYGTPSSVVATAKTLLGNM